MYVNTYHEEQVVTTSTCMAENSEKQFYFHNIKNINNVERRRHGQGLPYLKIKLYTGSPIFLTRYVKLLVTADGARILQILGHTAKNEMCRVDFFYSQDQKICSYKSEYLDIGDKSHSYFGHFNKGKR